MKTKSSVPRLKSPKATERINAKALELLRLHPQGMRWSELLSEIKKSDQSFHPKTVNGCVWKLPEKFPDRVYKPSRGIFRLSKYKSQSEIKNPYGKMRNKMQVLEHFSSK